MAWLFFIVGGVLVVGIAFVALGKVIGQLETERPPAVYDLPEAVDWIADRLPDEVTARLSYADVGRILGWHLDWFGEVGVASAHGEQLGGDDSLHLGSVAVDDAAVDAVVARALAESTDLDAIDVVCVLDLQMRYLRHIGAVGAVVEGSDRPADEI